MIGIIVKNLLHVRNGVKEVGGGGRGPFEVHQFQLNEEDSKQVVGGDGYPPTTVAAEDLPTLSFSYYELTRIRRPHLTTQR